MKQKPNTLAGWHAHALERYERGQVALGQVADNAHDEALYLLLRTLDLPLDSKPAVLRKKLKPAENELVEKALALRIDHRVPAAYLTQEAWLGEHRFYVDERVIIPRSYFLELIPHQLPLVPEKVRQAADICTGSGCLAILMAHHYPKAKIDAVDLSADALEVAAINLHEHRLARRIQLHQSDLFDKVPPKKYDLILSNPPYEPSSVCDKLPPEFLKEPRMALDGGNDGLDIIRQLVEQAKTRLAENGILAMEVGGLRDAMERVWPGKFHWLPTADGSDCVCIITAGELGKLPERRRRRGAKSKK